ncbi:hypothetical protein M7I_5180 [Glarea lozoyensis 74030]|uniref:Uncharacterized protein n=1 Tax=Glarea lozoyensis (strain ATCC 74030 / MF5533) TaxID=1104152 RepID=H0ER64_GLAL7|nr:hypothetical protein M7I_5180 [Glarea lozoyensis 74030]
MLQLTTLLALAASATAHYTFPSISGTSEWAAVRQWTGYQSNGPVTDVSLLDIRCNVGASSKRQDHVRCGPEYLSPWPATGVYGEGAGREDSRELGWEWECVV